jgi:hypothetical protein
VRIHAQKFFTVIWDGNNQHLAPAFWWCRHSMNVWESVWVNCPPIRWEDLPSNRTWYREMQDERKTKDFKKSVSSSLIGGFQIWKKQQLGFLMFQSTL